MIHSKTFPALDNNVRIPNNTNSSSNDTISNKSFPDLMHCFAATQAQQTKENKIKISQGTKRKNDDNSANILSPKILSKESKMQCHEVGGLVAATLLL